MKPKQLKRCNIGFAGELGPHLGTYSRSTSLEFLTAASLFCQLRKNYSFKVQIGNQNSIHHFGYTQKPFIDFSIHRNKWRVGLMLEKEYGDIQNYQEYNIPNVVDHQTDAELNLYFQYIY